MTVIAWDGTTLAGDTRLSDGADNLTGIKIYRLPDGRLFGGSGHAGYIARVLEWLGRGSKPKDRPDCSKFDRGSFEGLLIDGGHCFLLDTFLAPIPITSPRVAVGSGASHAMALMAAGMTAPEAVQTIITRQLADGVGGEVMTLALTKRRKPRKR